MLQIKGWGLGILDLCPKGQLGELYFGHVTACFGADSSQEWAAFSARTGFQLRKKLVD